MHGHALGLGHQHDEGRLPVGHEPGVGVGLHRGGPQAGVGAGRDVVVGDLEAGAHLLQRVDGGDQAVLRAAAHPHLPAGHQAGHQVRERLEPVALQPGLGAAQVLDALDDDAAVGLEADAGAHALQEQRQLGDLGLDRGVAQHGAALGEHGREQHALGGAHAGVGQRDLGAAQAVGLGGDAVVGRHVISAPMRSRASMWKSTGRRPMRSPPTSGHERLVVAGSSGPSRRIGMRLRPVNSSGTSAPGASTGSMVMRSPSMSTPTPSEVRMSAVMPTSPTSGALVIVLGCGAEHGGDHVLGHGVLRAADLRPRRRGGRWGGCARPRPWARPSVRGYSPRPAARTSRSATIRAIAWPQRCPVRPDLGPDANEG